MDRSDRCQLQTLGQLSSGKAEGYTPSLKKRIKNTFSTRLSPRFKRQLKTLFVDPPQWFRENIRGRRAKSSIPQAIPRADVLKSGERVRVRSQEEIEATLDRWQQLNGCSFMPEMEQYCDTVQQVFKPVRRFVDERDRSVRRTKGVVTLKGILCQGTEEFGACDRSCFYFWREEWLERI